MTEKVPSSIGLEHLVRELKNARTGKNLSIDDVSHLTRIQKSYLEKIEEGDFSFLPKVYIFTFIKEYALLMGVGNDETFEQCKKDLQLTSPPKSDVSIDRDVRRNVNFPSFRFPGKRVFLIVTIVFIVVLAGLSLFFINDKMRFSAPHSPKAVTLPSPTGDDTVAVAEQISDSLMITGANKRALNKTSLPSDQPSSSKVDSVSTSAPKARVSSSDSAHAPLLNSKEWFKNVSFLPSSKSSPYRKVLVVRLVDDYSWVKVIADDSAKVYPGGQFKNGQVLRYEARYKFWVNIGRPKYVELYLNGKKIPQSADRTLILQ